jgi:hypothetical protein
MAADEHTQPGAATAAGLFGDLQGEPGGGDHVVAADDALLLDTENLLKVDAPQRDEGRGRVGGRPRKLGVEGGENRSRR